MNKKNSLMKNASILMIATMISRVIGLLYRSPLGTVLGREGLGYYSYASNLYVILLLISSYSIPMAVSKVVSERLALKQYRNAHKVFQGALLYAALVGGVAALVAFFGGRILLPQNQQNAVLALRVLAPTIFLSAILGVFRGYFQAHSTMLPTSVSQVIEQILNAIVSVLAAYLLIKGFASDETTHAIYGAAGGTLGTGAGVLAGLLFMLFVYAVNRKTIRRQVRRDTSAQEESFGDVFRIIFFLVTPVIFTTFIYNASTYLDSYLFSSILGMHGISGKTISEQYGEFSNYYVTLINVPLALASASASAMMPIVSGKYATGEVDEANQKINETIRLTMFLAIPSAIGLAVLSKPIMGVLFPEATTLAVNLLSFGAISVIFSALSTITNSVLQSIGKQKIALRNAAVSLVVNLCVLALLLLAFPAMGIYAILAVNILFSISMCLLNGMALKKYLGFENEWKDTYGKPLLASVGMGLVAWILYHLLFLLLRRPFIGLVAAILAAVIVYLILYVVVTKTTEEEMRRFPMGTKIIRFLRLLHVYR